MCTDTRKRFCGRLVLACAPDGGLEVFYAPICVEEWALRPAVRPARFVGGTGWARYGSRVFI